MSLSSAFSHFGNRSAMAVETAPESPVRCRKCLTPVPSEAILARFCVNCGYPVAQPCPYEEAQASWLPVRAKADPPVTECPHCRNILLECDVCGRLYTLTERECRTERCTGQLTEPGTAFPSAAGPLDGTRYTHWPADFGKFQGEPILQVTAPLQALVCRYGRLVGVSDTTIFIWSWRNGNWQQQDVRILPEPPALAPLMLENGQVSVLMQSRAEAYFLGGLTAGQTVPGAFSLQALSREWWVGLSGNSLHVVRVATGKSHSYLLPSTLGPVADMHLVGPASSETVLLAGEQSLLMLDPASGETHSPVLPGVARWVQTGITGGRLFALGFESKGLIFCRLSAAGIEESHIFPDEMLGAFTLTPSAALFINRSQGYIEVLDLDELNRTSRTVSLPGAPEIGPDFQALRSRDGRTLLLLRLLTPSSSKFMLIDTATGATSAVPGAFGGTSQFCIAGTRLVISAVDSGGAKLRTYQF